MFSVTPVPYAVPNADPRSLEVLLEQRRSDLAFRRLLRASHHAKRKRPDLSRRVVCWERDRLDYPMRLIARNLNLLKTAPDGLGEASVHPI